MTFRVLTGQFVHETNTFAKVMTDIAAFERLTSCRGEEEILAHLACTNTEAAGYIDAAQEHGWELIHTVAASANPLGLVTDEAFEHFVGMITQGLEEAGEVDGIALALHGAMVSQSHEDAETELVRRLRAIAGPEVPICCTFDLHANVGPDFADMVQIVCSYLTYPHIDMRVRAKRAGDLLHQAMMGEIKPVLSYARRPMVQGADGGRTDVEPMIGLLKRAKAAMATDPSILDVSINAGFNQSDIFDVGPSVLVTSDDACDRGQVIAEDLMDEIWETRHVVNNRYLSVGEAAEVARSFNHRNKPLVIADYADNPGSGAYGDATNLLAAMLEAQVQDACFGPMFDPASAADLHRADLGARITLHLGGKTDPTFGGPPLLLTGDIIALSDGATTFDGPMMAGVTQSFGPTAVFRVDGIEILVVSNLMQIIDLQQFLAHGIDPRTKKTVALKSMQHFRAAYEPLAEKVIVCDSGALATPDFTRFDFTKVRRPMFPFDSDDDFTDLS